MQPTLHSAFRADAADVDRTRDDSLRPLTAPTPVDPRMSPDVDIAPRYAVKGTLGKGGMGEVRLCHDARVGRDVAVKVAHRADAGAELRARFLREARVQGQLEHPAIVPVYDLEVFADGSAYFAMKRVRGRTLSSILAALGRDDEEVAARFPLRRLLAAFTTVCLAVEYAHGKGVVHRDIKPANIMLGDYGEVYLLDWGLAKIVGDAEDDVVVDGAPADADGATGHGAVLGTPGWMAPEQIDPSIAPVGPAADVYALGAVLFEIVALRRYVEGKGVAETTLRTLQGGDPRPSVHAARPDAPAALDDACARALALAPADRWPSARALHDAVDAFLSGEEDRERRRAAARVHVEHAARRGDGVDERAAALRDLGSALALDPENTDARRELLRLMTSLPSAVPDAVVARVHEDETERVRAIARLRAAVGLAFVPFVAIFVVLEPALHATFGLAFGAILTSCLMNARSAKKRAPGAGEQMLAYAVYLFGVACLGGIAGPLVVVPTLLAAFAVEMQVHPDRRQRVFVLIASCATLAIAFGVEMTGVLPPSYELVDGEWTIRSRMTSLQPATLWLVFLASLATIVTPSLFVGQVRGALARADARRHVQAWQLERMVPHQKRG